ncbi:MAG: hypothetical protein E7449_01275 [Ruminococcaceae bacterium]|nr:hypothetical protein [Oscillospiraceae bacterium]
MEINQKYMLVPGSFRNVVLEDGNMPGFTFGLRIPYYRGVALSMVDDLWVKYDNLEFPKEKLIFTVGGHSYTWPMIETITTFRWEYAEAATVFVPLEGGFDVGSHMIEVGCAIRMSYGGRVPHAATVRQMVSIAGD